LLDVLLISAASVALILFGSTVLTRLNGFFIPPGSDLTSPPLAYNAAIAGLETLALIASVFLLGIWRKKLPLSAVGLRKAPVPWLVASILLTLLVIPLMGLLALGIQLALGQPVENPQLEFLVPENFSWPGAIGMFLMGGVAVPFAEELFFRGVLYQWMRSFMNVWIAIPLNAILFGALHGNIAIAGATALLGLLLAWFFEHSRSLWPSVIIHVTNNALKLFLLYILIALGVDVSGL
jgi:membrane protease YdiL (CAAX protease family)